jgi:hypothetical protein
MATLTYHGPDGDEISNPGEEFLRDVVLHAPAATWEVGSGDSGLVRSDTTEALVFFAVEPFGMYVAFIQLADADVVTTRSPDTSKIVAHHIGGEPFVAPAACYLPRPLAWEVVREFARHGRRLDSLKWVSLGELEYEDPNQPGGDN